MTEDFETSRRGFLKIGLLATAGLAFPVASLAKGASFASPSDKTLSLLNSHTGERLDNIVFWENGDYLKEGLDAINYLCRDFRNDEIKPIDRRLLDLLYEINLKLPVSNPQNIIISGYRSRKTNEKLRKRSHKVAKRSYHLKGQALDIRAHGCDLRVLKKAALRLHQGGVGYYPRSQFIHIDTGPVRSW